MDENTLAAELRDLKNRIIRVEEKLGIMSARAATPQQVKTPVRELSQEVNPNLLGPIKAESKSGNLLGAVGVLFFILAASFFIKLSIDSGWLTPARQLGCAYVFAFLLIGFGFYLKDKYQEYASYLPANGLVILFMCVYAGHLHFQFYGSVQAVVLAGAVSLGSLYLFTFFKSDIYLIVSIVGSYLVPFLIPDTAASVFGASMYFMFWGVLFCLSAILLRKRLLIAVTSYFAITTFQFVLTEVIDLPQTAGLEWGIWLQLLQFVLFSAAIVLFSIRWKQQLTSAEAWALLPALFIFYGFEYSMIESLQPALAPWVSLGFGVFIFALYSLAKELLKKDTLESSPMVAAFVAMVLFHSVYLELWPKHYAVELGLICLLGLGFLMKVGVDTQKYWAAFLFLWTLIGIEYFSSIEVGHSLAGREFLSYGLINLSFMLVIGVFYLSLKSTSNASLVLFFAGLQALFGLQRIAEFFVYPPISSYLTSGLWGVLALLILAAALQLKDRLLANSAVLILWLVSAKVLFMDLSASSPIVRIVTLCIVGAILYSSGMILRKFKGSD